MRIPVLALTVGAALLLSCGSGPAPPPTVPAKAAASPAPPDESRYLPAANRIDTTTAAGHLLDQPFMPGGTTGRYRKGKTEYIMFIAKLPTPQDAAFLLPEWRKALAGAKLVPSFGGYFGIEGERPVFVFAKGAWIAGVAGLAEKDADAAARGLAARLD